MSTPRRSQVGSRPLRSRLLVLIAAASCGPSPSAPASPQSASPERDADAASAPRASEPAALQAALTTQDAEVVTIVETARAAVRAATPGTESKARAWLELGMALEANHLPDLAVGAYDRATTLTPDEAKTWYRLAVAHESAGQVQDALTAYRRALQLEQRFPPLHWRLGLLLLENGELDEARAAFRTAVRLHPRDPSGWTGLARVHLQLDKPLQAIENLKQVFQLVPNEPYARSLYATALRQAGRFDEWRGAPPATGVEPNWPDPLSLELARFRATTDFTRESRAATSERRGRSVQTLEALLAGSPQDPSLLAKLGRALAEVGRRDEAIARLQEALALRPDQRDLLVDLGILYVDSGEAEDLARAEPLLLRAVERNPSYGRAHEALADYHDRKGESAAAIASLREALRHDQRRADPFVRLGFLELRAGQSSSAAERFAAATALAPEDARPLLGAALCAVERGDRDAARAFAGRVPEGARSGKLWERVQTAIASE